MEIRKAHKMIVKSYEMGALKVFMVMVTNDIYYLVYINGNKSQIIKNNAILDFETTSEIFDYLIDKPQKTKDTNEMGQELFTKDEFDKLLDELEREEE